MHEEEPTGKPDPRFCHQSWLQRPHELTPVSTLQLPMLPLPVLPIDSPSSCTPNTQSTILSEKLSKKTPKETLTLFGCPENSAKEMEVKSHVWKFPTCLAVQSSWLIQFSFLFSNESAKKKINNKNSNEVRILVCFFARFPSSQTRYYINWAD